MCVTKFSNTLVNKKTRSKLLFSPTPSSTQTFESSLAAEEKGDGGWDLFPKLREETGKLEKDPMVSNFVLEKL